MEGPWAGNHGGKSRNCPWFSPAVGILPLCTAPIAFKYLCAPRLSRRRPVNPGQTIRQDSVLQLFTVMFGDMQYSTMKDILRINTVASRLAVTLAGVCARPSAAAALGRLGVLWADWVSFGRTGGPLGGRGVLWADWGSFGLWLGSSARTQTGPV
jgi:hypothetical protein